MTPSWVGQQRCVSRKVLLRVCEVGLVLGFVGERELELRLIGPGIDLEQQIAFFDVMALDKRHSCDVAVDAAFDGHRVERLNRSEPAQNRIGKSMVLAVPARTGTGGGVLDWDCSWAATAVWVSYDTNHHALPPIATRMANTNSSFRKRCTFTHQ